MLCKHLNLNSFFRTVLSTWQEQKSRWTVPLKSNPLFFIPAATLTEGVISSDWRDLRCWASGRICYQCPSHTISLHLILPWVVHEYRGNGTFPASFYYTCYLPHYSVFRLVHNSSVLLKQLCYDDTDSLSHPFDQHVPIRNEQSWCRLPESTSPIHRRCRLNIATLYSFVVKGKRNWRCKLG